MKISHLLIVTNIHNTIQQEQVVEKNQNHLNLEKCQNRGDIHGNTANKIPYRGHDTQRIKECALKGKACSLKFIPYRHLFALKKPLYNLLIA